MESERRHHQSPDEIAEILRDGVDGPHPIHEEHDPWEPRIREASKKTGSPGGAIPPPDFEQLAEWDREIDRRLAEFENDRRNEQIQRRETWIAASLGEERRRETNKLRGRFRTLRIEAFALFILFPALALMLATLLYEVLPTAIQLKIDSIRDSAFYLVQEPAATIICVVSILIVGTLPAYLFYRKLSKRLRADLEVFRHPSTDMSLPCAEPFVKWRNETVGRLGAIYDSSAKADRHACPDVIESPAERRRRARRVSIAFYLILWDCMLVLASGRRYILPQPLNVWIDKSISASELSGIFCVASIILALPFVIYYRKWMKAFGDGCSRSF